MSDERLVDSARKIEDWSRQEIVPYIIRTSPLTQYVQTLFGSPEYTLGKIIAADERRHDLATKMSRRFSAPEICEYQRRTEQNLRGAETFYDRVRGLVLTIVFILGFGVFAAVMFSNWDLMAGAFWLAAFIAAMHIVLTGYALHRLARAGEINEIAAMALDASRLSQYEGQSW